MLTAVLLLLPGLAMADTDPLFWPLRYDERGLPLTDVIIDCSGSVIQDTSKSC